MKRTFKYALTAVLGIGLVAPAFAQTDNFPDVPENHWAYEALARLKKDGLLVGYPDGLFRGPRPASRYELAVAIHAVYTNLRNVTDGLQSQIDALKNNTDVQSLREQIATLQNQINAFKTYGDDIASLKKLTSTFEKELTALGVDVDQLKKDLGDLARRVIALEAKKPAVDISGDANFFLVAGNGKDNMPGLNKDGRLEGILPNSTGSLPVGTATAGLDKDLSVLNEVAVTLAGTNTTGPTWKGTIVYGNTLSGLGNESTASLPYAAGSKLGTQYTDTGTPDIYVQDFSVKFNTSVAGLGFNAEVGRIGYKISPYILQRMNTSSYYVNDRWSNGEYYLDGGNISFNLLSAKVDVFGGRTSNQITSAGTNINPLQSGPLGGPMSGQVLPIARTLGIDASVPITSAGSLKVAYLWLDADPTTATNQYPTFGSGLNTKSADRLEVYGGTLNFALGVIKLQGDYAKSNLKLNATDVNTTDDDSWQAKASYSNSKWGVYGLYREIGANFAAPGDWGRIGILRNPTNIKGFTAGANLNLSSSLVLKANYEQDKGKDDGYDLSVFNTSTKVDKYDVSLGYKLNSALDLSVGYEDDKFSSLSSAFTTAGDPEYKWTTFGIGYGLSDAARLTLSYELSDVSNEFVLPTLNSSYPTRYKGGILTSQLTVKF